MSIFSGGGSTQFSIAVEDNIWFTGSSMEASSAELKPEGVSTSAALLKEGSPSTKGTGNMEF